MLDRLKAAVKAFQRDAVKKTKTEPRVEIIGAVHDPKKGVKIDLDWNEEFVDYLRENGITGTTDEVVVQKWVTLLFRDMLEASEEKAPNEFE